MATMEKLFAEIFEGEKRIIQQAKHQADLFDHHLASICLLDGIAPPPWLLPPSFPPVSSDLHELKKEQLISGLLLQRSQSANPHFSSHNSLYQEPIVMDRNKGLPNASGTEAYASNNNTDAGDRLSVRPPFSIDDTQCTVNDVPELDGSVTSHPECADERIPDNCQDPAQSLAKIQRSKSRQRALELRNSAKANKVKSCKENTAGAHTSQKRQSSISPLPYDHFDELVLAKHVDASNKLFVEESKSVECAGKEKNCDVDCDRTIRSGSCSQQIGSVNETGNNGNLSYIGNKDTLNMSKNCPLPLPGCAIGLLESFDPSVLADSSSGAEANLVGCRGNKKNSIVCYDKMAESRTSISQASTQKEPLEAGKTCVDDEDDGDERALEKSAKNSSCNNELLKSSPVISNKSYKKRKANRSDEGVKGKDSNVYVGRMTRSRSSQRHVNCMNECLEFDNVHSNGKENGVSKTKQLSDDAHDLIELVKPLDTNYASGGVRAKLMECEKVDAENGARDCRIASSSTKKINDFSEFPKVDLSSGMAKHGDGALLQSLGRSSPPPQPSSFGEEGVNLQITSGIQPNILPPPESLMAENITDIYFNGIAETCSVTSKSNSGSAGCGVEHSESKPSSKCVTGMKAKQLDFDDVEASCLIKPSEMALENKQEGMRDLLDDPQEKPSISIEMPLQKQSGDSSKQENVRKDSSQANLKDNADLVEERSVNSSQQVMRLDESKPPSECAIVMKAKQLDFDHVEENSLRKSSKMALENKQEGTTEKQLSLLSDDSQEKPSISIETSLQKQQEDSSKQDNVRKDSSEANLKDNAYLVEERSVNSAQQVMGLDESKPPSECAIFMKAKQLDFDHVEKNSFHNCYKMVLENKQEGRTEKRLSLLSDDSQEKPIVMSLHKQQEDSSKQEKVRKDSSEPNLKDNADFVEEKSFNSAQQVVGSFVSRSQHKRMKIGSQLTNSLSPTLKINPCQPFDKYNMGDPIQSDAIMSLVDDAAWNAEHQNVEESEIPLPKLHGHEVELNLERKSGVNALTPMLDQAATAVASLKKLEAGFSPGCLLSKPEGADPNSTIFNVTGQHTAEDNQVLLQERYTEHTTPERRDRFGEKNSLSHLSSGSPHSLSVAGTGQHMPEYEGFFVESDTELPCTTNEGINFDKLDLPPTALRRASVPDQFCKSINMCAPLSHSTAYKSHEALNLYHSVPNGLLEGILMNTYSVDGDESKLINSSYSSLNEGVNNDLYVNSQSVPLLFSNTSAWDTSKPCMSPVGKFWDAMPPKFGSSGKRVSSIPELPCISEENENTDPLTSVCEAGIQDERSSIASLNIELGLSGTSNTGRKKLRDNKKRRFTSKDKENQNTSLGGDSLRRGKASVPSRFSKPKLSEKAGLRKGGPSLSEKESKRSNIVSNISSFVPLVQQKQAAAVITGKRDIKVKSLEAAEAAKRLAEKKENERKMKKEALKIERAEANLRQLELEKKKKEEEKKKRDADMAAKKRQREEGERKEKERKKMRNEEAKRNHLECEKKLQIKKEEREVKLQARDEGACNRKESKKFEKAKLDNNLRTFPGSNPASVKVATIGTINANINVEDHEAFSGDNSKVMGFFGKPSENNSLVSSVTQEQSYDISPYKGSDDEDEDENMQNNKYRPSWASQSQLALAVSSQKRIDPESIFPPGSFCSISKVLLPRRLQHI